MKLLQKMSTVNGTSLHLVTYIITQHCTCLTVGRNWKGVNRLLKRKSWMNTVVIHRLYISRWTFTIVSVCLFQYEMNIISFLKSFTLKSARIGDYANPLEHHPLKKDYQLQRFSNVEMYSSYNVCQGDFLYRKIHSMISLRAK
jgi:amino acid permease